MLQGRAIAIAAACYLAWAAPPRVHLQGGAYRVASLMSTVLTQTCRPAEFAQQTDREIRRPARPGFAAMNMWMLALVFVASVSGVIQAYVNALDRLTCLMDEGSQDYTGQQVCRRQCHACRPTCMWV